MIEFAIRHYDSIGSTSDEARRLAEAGAPHGTVVIAREQTAGRGRQGRQWASPPGNLYISIILCLGLAHTRLPELGFVAALAAADTVEAFTDRLVTLKWPNDVLVDAAKIAGILTEHADPAIILGIGINVGQAPTGTPYKTTTLNGPSVDAVGARLLEALAQHVTRWSQDGFAPIRAGWLARAHPPGTPLRIILGDAVIEGRFADLAPDGALLLRTGTITRRILAGEVLVAQSADR